MSAEKPNPYPTPTRLRLARAIASPLGLVRHYHFVSPETRDIATDALVTSRVAELAVAGLAELGEPQDGHNYSIVSLTPAGEEWLKTYGGTE